MKILRNLLYLFFPEICITCQSYLLQSEELLCTRCRHDLPIIRDKNFKDNKIITSFFGRIPIEMAVSFLFYRKVGKTRKLIHSLKYKGNQKVGEFIGNWFGFQLKESGDFNKIDCIIPVPLHPKRLKERGYNQLTIFGISLADKLDTVYKPDILIRTSYTKTQTFKKRFKRFDNMDTKFSLTDTNTFRGKHILLIDDVITTGATLGACCKELLKTENIKISIVTIACPE